MLMLVESVYRAKTSQQTHFMVFSPGQTRMSWAHWAGTINSGFLWSNIFYRLHALLVAQPTVSKHWRHHGD